MSFDATMPGASRVMSALAPGATSSTDPSARTLRVTIGAPLERQVTPNASHGLG
jgi:hypothetical protein